jgi:hypothetical protein
MRGGKRKRSGRPKGEPTTTLSFRVKLTEVEELKELVKAWKSTKNPN